MASTSPKIQEILLPAKPAFVFATLVTAVLLALLPWGGIALLLRPNFVALALLYWCIHQPRMVGIGTSWGLGILMDVANASVLGQNALAYSILAFAAVILHRRIRMCDMSHQMGHILALLLVTQTVHLLISLASGVSFSGWTYFLSSATGAALWPVLSIVLQIPQRPTSDPDSV